MPTFWAAPCPHHTPHASWRQGRHSCIYFHYHLFWPISSSGAPFLGRATQSHEHNIYQTNPSTFIKNLSWHSMFQHFQLISNHYKEQLSLIQLVYPLYTSMGKGIHCWRNIGQKIHLGLGTSLSADEMMVCVRMLTWLINSIIFIWPCAVVAMPHTTLWSLDNYTSWSLFQIRYSLQWPHWTPQPTVDDLKILTRD